MNIDLYYRLELRDKEGKLLNRPRRKRADSYVQAFLGALYGRMADDTAYKLPAITGVSQSPAHFRISAGTYSGSYGLKVGLSSAAVTISDHRLGTPCSHGTGANQFIHNAVTFLSVSTSGGKRYFRISRGFYNDSGSTITIREVGAITSSPYHLHFRDLSTLAVADGNTATLVYEESITV